MVGEALYERVRADSTTFVLLPGHGETTVENMVEQSEGFVIARNFGQAAVLARLADPRRLAGLSKQARLVF